MRRVKCGFIEGPHGLSGCMLGPGKVDDEDIQVKYGVAGSSPVFCDRGVRPREGCCVKRIINIHVK